MRAISLLSKFTALVALLLFVMRSLKLTNLAAKLAFLIVLLAATASLICATSLPVRGSSNYGIGPDFSGCASVPPIPICGEGFNLTPTGFVTLNGSTFPIVQFAADPSFLVLPGGGDILNVVDLGRIGPNTTFSLPPSFFTPKFTEVFTCNDAIFAPATGGSLITKDSGGNVIPGPCTAGVTSIPDISLNPDGSFTTGANFNLTDLVLDSPVPTNAPEPATLLLLGAGLLAVGRKFRRVC